MDSREFDDIFSPGSYPLNPHKMSPEDYCLSGLMGAAWGCFQVRRDPLKPKITISRHEAQDRRVWIEPDRRDYADITLANESPDPASLRSKTDAAVRDSSPSK